MFRVYAILWFIVTIACTRARLSELEEDRKKWFNRIKKYERIHVDLDEFHDTNVIRFDAFGAHYKVQLIVNEHVASPDVLRHTGDGQFSPHPHDHGDACYYHGKVLNDDGRSRVVISACAGEGIRGKISAFGEEIWINPAAYYFAPFNDSALADEHIIYKNSDYDWEKESASWGELHSLPIPGSSDNISPAARVGNTSISRRRLARAGQVELVTLIDDSWLSYFQGNVRNCLSHFKSAVNYASELYSRNNLPSEYAITINYRYAVLDEVSSCNSNGCLGTGKRVMQNIRKSFDYGFFYVRHRDEGGWSYGCGICKSAWKYGVSLSQSNTYRCGKVLAHEMGHNMQSMSPAHDPTRSGYIMDPTGSGNTWSKASIEGFEDCDDRGATGCIYRSGMSGSVSGGNYENKIQGGGGGGGGGGGSSSGPSCVKLYNFDDDLDDLNGYYSKYSNERYNQDGSSMYISRFKYNSGMRWGAKGGVNLGSCREDDIEDCDGEWDYWLGGGGRVRSSSSCRNAFNAHPECLDDYDNTVCLYHGTNTESNPDRYEVVEEEGCFNDAPVFRFIDDDASHMFYLHYNEDGNWLVSDGAITRSGVYFCEESDLRDCVEGQWAHEVFDTTANDTINLEVVDGVRIGSCGNMNESSDVNESSPVVGVLIGVIVALIIALIVCGVVMMRQRKSMDIARATKFMMDESGDEATEITKTVAVSTTEI